MTNEGALMLLECIIYYGENNIKWVYTEIDKWIAGANSIIQKQSTLEWKFCEKKNVSKQKIT